MKILVTGSSGLIGSGAVEHFHDLGHEIVGIDNDMRSVFFGEGGSTRWNQRRLETAFSRFRHVELDIRDRAGVFSVFEEERFDAVIHTAAQPSHDKAADIPILDFEVNAGGTVNLLEANRRFSLDSPFVHLSTNKVYGDRPNGLSLVELDTRHDFADPEYAHGIDENFPIDQSKHSLFGASKVAADVMVQEYGRYFGMPTVCLRGGCLTGPAHSGVELHGFLSYLIRCNLTGRHYTVFGYQAKQVRDNIHTTDVARFMERFLAAPRPGAVYNLGGGKANSVSMTEAFALAEELTGKPMQWSYSEENRVGDHIVYYSDLRRMKADYPGWAIAKDIRTTFEEIVEAWNRRLRDEATT